MNPHEYASEIDAIRDLRHNGYSVDWEFRDNAFCDSASGRRFRPEELTIVEHYRFEGESDPEDMSVVYAIESDDGARGIVMDAFGAYADPGLAEFLAKIMAREHA